MLKIVFLGTAASIPTKERDNTSLLLYANKESPLLIDCPGSIVQKLKRAKVDHTRLTTVVITHHHPDHLYGIVSLLHCQFKMTKKVTILSSPRSIAIIKDLVRLFGLTGKDYPRIRFIDLLARKKVTLLKGMTVRAFRNQHSPDSFGVSLGYKDTHIVYSSDTALTKKIASFVNKKTYLIHDCTASSSFFRKYPRMYRMHTESSQLKKLAKKLRPKLVLPVHFLLLEKGELGRIRKELQGVKNIFLPEDGTSLTLP